MNFLARGIFGVLSAYSKIAPSQAGGYRLARIARRAVPREKWRDRFITPDELKLDIDLGTYPDCCMAVGLFEIDTYRLLKSILKPGNWFVDCGANLGYFSLLASKWVEAQGRVDAFEPSPQNRKRLEAHLLINDATNVRVHGSALSNATGEIDFFHPTSEKSNHGMATMFRSLSPKADRFVVPTVRLDEAIDGIPDVIKMDVEGAELAAIGGAEKILRSERPPKLIIEHNHETSAAAGHLPSAIFEAIVSIQPRYKIFWVGRKLRRISDGEELNGLHRQGNLLVET